MSNEYREFHIPPSPSAHTNRHAAQHMHSHLLLTSSISVVHFLHYNPILIQYYQLKSTVILKSLSVSLYLCINIYHLSIQLSIYLSIYIRYSQILAFSFITVAISLGCKEATHFLPCAKYDTADPPQQRQPVPLLFDSGMVNWLVLAIEHHK